MADVGIRALKQNASAVAAGAASGETITIADRARPVAKPMPIVSSRLVGLVEAGRASAQAGIRGGSATGTGTRSVGGVGRLSI